MKRTPEQIAADRATAVQTVADILSAWGWERVSLGAVQRQDPEIRRSDIDALVATGQLVRTVERSQGLVPGRPALVSARAYLSLPKGTDQ